MPATATAVNPPPATKEKVPLSSFSGGSDSILTPQYMVTHACSLYIRVNIIDVIIIYEITY
jgi:hypothetical protein